MASFVFVLLLPIGFFIYSLFENTWEKAQQNMLQKHELIASAMVEPISLFITSRQQSLQNLGDEIRTLEIEGELAQRKQNNPLVQEKIQTLLNKYQKYFRDLTAISYVSNLSVSSISIKDKYKTNLPQSNLT